MNHQRGYIMKSTAPVPEEDRAAARRSVARHVTNESERAQVEAMLGLDS